MPDIKLREVNRGTIKTMDRSIVASKRIRDLASETKTQAQNHLRNEDDNVNEYAQNHISQAVRESVYASKRAANEISPYAKDGAKIAINKYKIRRAENRLERERSGASREAGKEASKIKSRPKAEPQTDKVIRAQQNQKRMKQSAQKMSARAKQSIRSARQIADRIAKAARAIAGSTKALIAAITAGGWIAIAVILCCVIFGAAFYFFGDESSQNYTPVSAEVEAYTPLLQEYANKYGIGEYTELIKAVMMQESGGKGKDPMQASECGYNKKYPKKPNGITSPEYSIACGVHYLADCLKSAKCQNPLDMDHIRLALQGYNFGSTYITWAIKRDGGYTVENADIFSDQQAAKHGGSTYGDKQYVAHVLRYYPFGSYNYGIGNTKITQVAAQQIGNKGGQKFWSWYGFSGRVEWCACFVSWCANQCGYIKSGTIPKSASVASYVSWFKAHGQWQKRSYKPSPGDLIIFDWDSNGTVDHIGIVEACDGKTVSTIEGNSGDTCKRRTYTAGRVPIYGYCVPKY